MKEAHDIQELRRILSLKSVRFGDFTLSSGEKSDVYVDAKLTTCFSSAMPLIGRIFLEQMRNRNWLPDAVGGLTLGADPIAFAIARESLSQKDHVNAFIVRKAPKPHGMERFIEGMEHTQGVSVVIIDDVCTKGGSTAQAIEKAQAAGMKVLGAMCLVDRKMGAQELLRQRFGCELESIFALSDLRATNESHRSSEPVEAGM